jgi:hypothetical protein
MLRRQIRNSWQSRTPKKSPLKDNPLRNPGQSLDETIQNLLDEDASSLAAVIVFCNVITAYEWWRWYTKIPYSPGVVTFVCGVITSYCIFRLSTLKKQLKALRLARDGEKAVGQYLEMLRELGYRVFHDIPGKNFNLDHVIIGPKGIFTIETKTFSKPVIGKANVYFDGTSINVNGYKPERDPIVQALAQASWLSDLVKDSTGHKHSVKPVVVFPGWFVCSGPDANSSNVWVINPKGLPKFLDCSPQKLSSDEIQLIAYHLSRYIRTQVPYVV